VKLPPLDDEPPPVEDDPPFFFPPPVAGVEELELDDPVPGLPGILGL
jgi:hypothetical protein